MAVIRAREATIVRRNAFPYRGDRFFPIDGESFSLEFFRKDWKRENRTGELFTHPPDSHALSRHKNAFFF
jgi:hypothetical protein